MQAVYRYVVSEDLVEFWRADAWCVKSHPERMQILTLPKRARAVIFTNERFHDLGEFVSQGEALVALAFIRKHVSGECPQFPPNRFLDPDDYEQPTMAFDYRNEIPRGVRGRKHPHGDYGGAVIDKYGEVLHVCDMAQYAEWTTEQMHQIEFNAHVLADDDKDEEDVIAEPALPDPRKKAARNGLAQAMYQADLRAAELTAWSNLCHRANDNPPDWLSVVDKDGTWWDRIKQKHEQCAAAYDAARTVTMELRNEIVTTRKRLLEQ